MCPRTNLRSKKGVTHPRVVRRPCYSEYARGQWHCVGSCGSFLEMQHPRPHPDLVVQNLRWNEMCSCVRVKFEKRCCKTCKLGFWFQLCHFLAV